MSQATHPTHTARVAYAGAIHTSNVLVSVNA